jgi:hypothetical protein
VSHPVVNIPEFIFCSKAKAMYDFVCKFRLLKLLVDKCFALTYIMNQTKINTCDALKNSNIKHDAMLLQDARKHIERHSIARGNARAFN